MTKPLIGVTSTVWRDEDRLRGYGIGLAYLHAVENAGGLPVMIAPNLHDDTLRQVYDRLDGLLLIGGGDVDPALYGQTESPSAALRSVDAARDSTEIALSRWALADNKPLLGVCRGVQVMNVALGGTLYRDLATERAGVVNHDLENVGTFRLNGHAITVSDSSRLAVLLGSTALTVNSFHHQAVQTLGAGLLATATASDGLIEAVEQPDKRFFVGVQWHPEVMFDDSPAMQRLFGGLITASAQTA